MAYEHRNIIVGAADVYMSVDDSTTWTTAPALPDFVADVSLRTTLDGASTDWSHRGFTQGGVEVTYAPDYGAVEVDQLLDDAKLFKTRQTVTVATTFVEATLRNLLIAWGQGEGTLTGDATTIQELLISAGELGDEPVERSIALVGQAPRGTDNLQRERVYHLERVLQVESSAHSLSRAESTGIPVSFRCLPGGSSASLYGRVIDRVLSAATPTPPA